MEGFSFGTGLAVAYDSRDNRYNTYKGGYAIGTLILSP
jgi:hypothetical protein